MLSQLYGSVNDFVKEGQLNNGICLVTQGRLTSKTIDFSVNVGTGSFDDPLDKQGVAHFLEHLLVGNELNSQIQRRGGKIELLTYADTINLSGTIPNTPENKALVIRTIKTFLKGLDLNEELFEKEKVRILNEIGIDTDTATRHQVTVLGKAFKDNRADGNITGTRNDVNKITIKDLRSYLSKNFTADNIFIAVTGKFPRSNLEQELEEALRDIPPHRETKILYSPEVVPEYHFEPNPQLLQTYFSFCFPLEQSKHVREEQVSLVAGRYLSAIADRDIIFGSGIVYSFAPRLLSNARRIGYLDIRGNIMREDSGSIVPATSKLITDVISDIEPDVFEGVILGFKSGFNHGQILPPGYSAGGLSHMSMAFGHVITDAVSEASFSSITAEEVSEYFESIFSKDPAIVVYGDDSKFGNYDDFVTPIRGALESTPS